MSRPSGNLPRDPGQRGWTLPELLIAVALISLLSVVITKFISTTRLSISKQEASWVLQQRALRMVSNLRGGLEGGTELLENYPDSNQTAVLNLRSWVLSGITASASVSAGVPQPVAFTLTPTVTSLDEVDMNGPSDSGASAWGNEIMYVSVCNPLTFTAYYASSACGTGTCWSPVSSSAGATVAETVSIGRYQFVYDYLTWTRAIVSGLGPVLRVAEWRSGTYIDASNLTSLQDVSCCAGATTCCPRFTAACQYLYTTGNQNAFNPVSTTSATCFLVLTSTSASLTNESSTAMASPLTNCWAYLDDFDLTPSFRLDPTLQLGRIARNSGSAEGQIAGQATYSVAYDSMPAGLASVPSLTLQSPSGILQVPKFGAVTSPMGTDPTGGPAGFEVGICGMAGSREIVLHLTLMASTASNVNPYQLQAYDVTSEISLAISPDF
jgi:prepilin-type N-terminal cleavage/methylation domain-containing protein